MKVSEIPFRPNFEDSRSREILREWNNIIMMDRGNGPKRETPKFRCGFKKIAIA